MSRAASFPYLSCEPLLCLIGAGLACGLSASAHAQQRQEAEILDVSPTESPVWGRDMTPSSNAERGGVAVPRQSTETVTEETGKRRGNNEVTGIDPLARLGSRIPNRVQNRLRNRIDRYFDPRANATSPFVIAKEEAENSRSPRSR